MTVRVYRNKVMHDYWTIPKLWPGATCYILGGGPSLKEIDVNRLKGQRVIAVNNAYRLGDWIDVMFYGDCNWLSWHHDELINWPGLKVTTCDNHRQHAWIKVVRKVGGPFGLSRKPDIVTWNKNSGSCAINLATHFGVKKIVLLGFDMRQIDGDNNWHKDHKNAGHSNPYARFLKSFPQIASDAKRMGVEIVNATPGSAIVEFPIVDPDEILPKEGKLDQRVVMA